MGHFTQNLGEKRHRRNVDVPNKQQQWQPHVQMHLLHKWRACHSSFITAVYKQIVPERCEIVSLEKKSFFR
jgi:hypothetical protein